MSLIEVTVRIDDSKVTVLTRAARLRGLAVAYLTTLRDAALQDDARRGELSQDLANLDEVLAWLNEVEV